MQRTLVLSLLVLGAVVALVVGSYSALAGSGPMAGAVSAVVGSDDPHDGDVANSDETDDVDADGVVAQDNDNGEGAQEVGQVIADAFGASQEEVLALHEEGVGYGALFKLYALAAATGTSVDELLTTIPKGADGRYEFAFGKLFKDLTETEQATLESGPSNLGQLVSASHHPEDGGDEAAAEAAATGLEKAAEKFAAHASQGHGPPESVPAHGRD